MPMSTRLTIPFALMLISSSIATVLCAWQKWWRVERSGGHLADMPFGTFWEFLDNLPEALEHALDPREPGTILTILPSVYLWENVQTTSS
jgi:hypothetical protein